LVNGISTLKNDEHIKLNFPYLFTFTYFICI